MSEDNSKLMNVRPANSLDATDLRRVGAHPDYWYPVAWSDGVKGGQGAGAAVRGRAGRVVSGRERAGICAGGSLRASAGAAASGRGAAVMN